MMAPTQIYVSTDVPYVMKISNDKPHDGVLEQAGLDDCGIESTIVLGDSLSEELDDHEENMEEVSSEIVTVLSDDNTDYSMLSTDESGQQFLTVEDLAGSSFEAMPMLNVSADTNSEACGDWSEVGETLELSDDVVEDNEPVEEKPNLQPVIVQPVPDQCDDTPAFCLVIDGQPYNIIPAHQIVVTQQVNEANDEEEKFDVKEIKVEVDNTLAAKKKKLVRKKRSHPCFEPGCNRSYTTLHHLKVHMRKHQGFRPYRCPSDGCGKAFTEMYSYSTHIRTHTGEKPYKCTECSKGFKTSGDLLKHSRTHTGERPFKCPVEGCDKAFTTADIRKIHVRSHTAVSVPIRETHAEESTVMDIVESQDTDGGNGKKWKKVEAVQLIKLVHKNYQKFGNINYTNKKVWQMIAKRMGFPQSMGTICDLKWRNMKKTYRKIKVKQKYPGAGRVHWEFYTLIDKLLGQHIEVSPPTANTEDLPLTEQEPLLTEIKVEECAGNRLSEPIRVSSVNTCNSRPKIVGNPPWLEEYKQMRRESMEYRIRARKEKNEAIRRLMAIL